MRIVVEVGDWEHECCGPSYERDSIVGIDCLVASGPDTAAARYVESHHDFTTGQGVKKVRGRIADLRIVHLDGSTESIERLPSGSALRGFDDADDGHLEQPWTGEPVTRDSNQFLLTILT